MNLHEGESPWDTFPLEFPPGQDVVIQVRSTLYPGGLTPLVVVGILAGLTIDQRRR